MEQIYTPKQKYKVLTLCMTFNQSKYIEDTLNGFAMQTTDFPFACLVMDDCSTDGEQEVIKVWIDRECDIAKAEYVDLELSNVILIPHKKNKNCNFAFYLLKQNLYKYKKRKMSLVTPWRELCEYEAMCEGDDYWVSPNKLQLQIDYLDHNPDFSLCFHKVKTIAEKGRKHHDFFGYLETREYSITEMLKKWTVPTCSMVMRTSIIPRIPSNPNFKVGDNVIVLTCLKYGRMYCFGESMGIYRLSTEGWTGQSIAENCKKQIIHIKALMETFESCRNEIMNDKLRDEYKKLYSCHFADLQFEECRKVKFEYISIFKDFPFCNFLLFSCVFLIKYWLKRLLIYMNLI